MENITLTIILLWDVKRSLEKGQSVGSGIQIFLNRKSKDLFFIEVKKWWMSQNNSTTVYNKSKLSISKQQLLEILELGLKGQSILSILGSYEIEIIQNCEDEIQKHISMLPLILLIPLMLFIFPAIMILLIAPLLMKFQF